ncbi:hypothetical protein BN1723_019255, partial [Verticillium longisporum]
SHPTRRAPHQLREERSHDWHSSDSPRWRPRQPSDLNPIPPLHHQRLDFGSLSRRRARLHVCIPVRRR